MIRYLLGKCWTLFAVVTITAAVLLTFVRLMLPYVSLYKQDIQQWLSQAYGQPFRIGTLEAEWHGFGPRLKLYDVDFLDRNSGGVRISVKRAGITVDIPASLLHAQLRFGSLTVMGVNLSVVRHSDGSIVVAGFGGGGVDGVVSAEGNAALLDWLFTQQRLALEDSTIYWHDEALAQAGPRFVNVNLELRNQGKRHQFDGSASLPEDLGRRLTFAVDLQGDIFVAGGWDGRAYVNGSGLQTSQLLNWLPLAGIHVDDGIAEIRLWSEWQHSRLQQLDGELSVFGLNLSRAKAATAPAATEFIDSLSGRFSWRRRTQGWHLDIDRLILGRWGEFWPQSGYHLDWTDARPQAVAAGAVGSAEPVDSGGASDPGNGIKAVATKSPVQTTTTRKGVAKLQLWADYLRMDDILPLLMLTDRPLQKIREYAQALQPAGDLRRLYLQWYQGDPQHPGHLAVDSEFHGLSLQPWRKFPGISGLSGRLIADNQHGYVALTSRSMHFEAKPLFRQDLSIDSLDGDVQWRIGPQGWTLSGRNLLLGNADIQVSADVDATIPADGTSPYLDLVAGFVSHPGALANTGNYLPVAIMRKKTTAWLDRALVNGRITNGGLIFQGPLKHFPFDHKDGVFEIRFVVEEGILDYLPDWPRIEEIETEVLFSGRRLAINAVAGKILGADLGPVHAVIDDLTVKPALLNINGEVNGGLNEFLRFLQLSPLHKRYGRYVDGLEGQGQSRLTLGLHIPLAKGQKVVVNGKVDLLDSGLNLAGGLVRLSHLQGQLGFSNSGLQADGILGQLMGLDARFAVDSATSGAGVVTTISAGGNAAIEDIRKILDLPLFRQFSGGIDWQARLHVPGEDGAVGTLKVNSDLRGLATNLPAPLTKPVERKLDMVAEMQLPLALDRPLKVQVGEDLSMILGLDKGLHLQRGEIRFADGAAQMPARKGLRLAGRVPALSASEWLPLIDEERVNAVDSSSGGVNHIAVTVGDLELYRRHFEDARIDAMLDGKTWQGVIDSKQARGSVQLPQGDKVPLLLDMDYLYLSGMEKIGVEDRDDPRQIPSMRVQSKSFHFNDIDFGSLALTASHSPAGLHLTELHMQSSLADIKAHGDWLVANDRHYSSFDIAFSSNNFGKALSRFGYVDTIKGGKGVFNINARWPGAPLSFALARLDGNMSMSIDNGQLLEVDPGVGRVFGLLSLQALPRRLILDFRDVFNKGFFFDRIAGRFEIKGGDARTSDLVMKGPAGRIKIEGRVGLAKRDYDQQVSVAPDVSSTVPVVTALTQGAGVGAVVLLLQKMFEPKIDKAAAIRYRVTGPWENPVIKRLPEAVPGSDKDTNKQQK